MYVIVKNIVIVIDNNDITVPVLFSEHGCHYSCKAVVKVVDRLNEPFENGPFSYVYVLNHS